MKMWTLTFALLTVFYGVISTATDICEKGRDICFTTNEEPTGFPDSTEALDKICPFVINTLSCLVNYKNQCNIQNLIENPEAMDDNLEQIYELASDACNKDSELHRELSISLPCLARITRSYRNSCRPIVEDAVEAVRSRILGDDESTDDPEWSKHFCLYEALDLACFASMVAVTCGEEAKELVGIIADRTGYLDMICHADIREEVKELMSIMQTEMGEQLALKKFISKV